VSYLIQKKTFHSSHKLSCPDCNLVIISLSNLRKKNMSFYGNHGNTTPNIDDFFKKSFYFERAIAPASLTFSDAISFFYSLQTNKHKYYNRIDRDKAVSNLNITESLPKILEKNGFKTAAFVSDEDYAFENGLGKTFEYYFDKKSYEDHGIGFRPWQYNIGTKQLINPAINWIKENKGNKFFIFLQAYDLHCPYTPSHKFLNEIKLPHSDKIDFSSCFITLDRVEVKNENGKKYYKLYDWHNFLDKKDDKGVWFSDEDVKYLIALYEAELKEADNNLKSFFDQIKIMDLEKKTVFVFMSEHGDYLGESGYFMKAAVTGDGNLHNVNLSFPLMIKSPVSKVSYLQEQLLQTIDISPTILNLLGIQEIPKSYQGKSFIESLGNKKVVNDYAYSFSRRRRDYKDVGKFIVESVQNTNWKYNNYEHRDYDEKLLFKEEKIFNLKSDPGEENNLILRETDIYLKLKKASIEMRAKYEK
jgi:arylsulfatase A-like enzyme